MPETETNTQTRNREAWLTDFVALSLPLIKERTGLSQGSVKIKISCGFPCSGARVRKNGGYTAGQCHHTHGTDRKFFQIFIHPTLTDTTEIGGTVIHEVIHALLPGGTGHKKPFAQAAKKMGLVGKATQAGAEKDTELAARIAEIVEQLGEYPHEGLTAYGKKQTTRLLKAMCGSCGYTVRVTSKWIDEAGYPICPSCNEEMCGADAGEGVSDPLCPVSQAVEYKVKQHRTKPSDPIYDPRWSIFMKRNEKDCVWHVLDYGEPVESGNAFDLAQPPRLTPAESREDAISLLESLRDGLLTYKDIEVNDDEFEDDDWFDDSPDEIAEDEPETFDFDDDDSDPRFEFEKQKGIAIESINPDTEADKREAWALAMIPDAETV
jgi:hypothetical protein